MSHTVCKLDIETGENGKIELAGSVPAGTPAEVIVVLPGTDECGELASPWVRAFEETSRCLGSSLRAPSTVGPNDVPDWRLEDWGLADSTPGTRHSAFHEVVEARGPFAQAVIAFRTFLGENPGAPGLDYLANMAPRLVELRHGLKPTGLTTCTATTLPAHDFGKPSTNDSSTDNSMASR